MRCTLWAFASAGCLLLAACGSDGGSGEFPCALGDAAPFVQADGALVLSGSDNLLLGEGSCAFPRICVKDSAGLRVRGRTTLEIEGDGMAVIGGTGLGPEGTEEVTIHLVADGVADLYVLFENEVAPVTLILDAPRSSAMIAITGQAGLNVEGTGAETTAFNAGWGDTSNFPTCE